MNASLGRAAGWLIAGALCLPVPAWAAEQSAQVTMNTQMSSQYITEGAGGDPNRYQEDLQLRDGWNGGLDRFTLNANGGAWRLTSEARARHEADLGFSTEWERDEGFYISQTANLYPHYYDSSNRFYNTAPGIYDLSTTLRTLRGDFSMEAGVRAPDQPQAFIGYRHQSRDGETNSYWGGWLREAVSDNFILFVTPIQRERDEKSNTLYIGGKHQWAGWSWSAQQSFERFNGVDTYDEPGFYDDGQHIFTRYYRNQSQHTTWTTTLGGERPALDGRLHLSTQYQYAAVQTSSNTDADSLTPAGARHYGEHSLNYLVAEHGGRHHAQSLSGRADYTLCDWTRVWAGIRLLMGRTAGVSTRGEEGAEANAVDGNVATVDEAWAAKAVNREIGAVGEFGVEVTALPKTRLVLEASLDQSRTKYDWSADVSGSRNSGDEGDWSWLSRFLERRDTYSVSLRNWALPRMSVWTRYRYRVDDVDTDDQRDVANSKPGDPEYTETNTAFFYPGRIEDTRRPMHEVVVATLVRLTPRWSLRPQLEHRNSKYRVSNEAEPEISAYRSNTVAVGILGQPLDPLTCSLHFSRQTALTSTRVDSFSNTIGSPNATWFGGLTPDFDGSNTAFSSDMAYTWHGVTTELTSGAVDGNGDFDTTLVYGGIGFRGAVGRAPEASEWEVGYKYYDYHEDEQNGINDYTAHAIWMTLSKEF